MADTVFVTTAGLGIITERLRGSGGEPLYMGWGTGGATVAATTDTGLVTASVESRALSTSAQSTTLYANDTYQAVTTLTSLSAQTISEVAMFNNLSTGSCFLRATFTNIGLNIGDSIKFTNSIQFDST